ncbi:MAG: hypothetical protein ACLGGX_09765 [Bdellovibrionia bacterium]
MKNTLIVSLVLAGFVSVAQAQEEQAATTSTVNVSDVQNKDEQKKDIDDEITNARMRATLGSKSKWSFRSTLAYNGGSIEKPLDGVRPNYQASVGSTPGLAALGGSVGINYRASERDSLYLTTGVSILNPLQGDLTRNEFADPRGSEFGTRERFDVSGVTLGWSRGYKAFGLQMATDMSANITTDQDGIKLDKSIGVIDLSQTVLADLGESSWQAGVAVSIGAGIYSGKLDNAYAAATGAQQMAYYLGVYPFAEYAFNDTYSFRTVFGYFNYDNLISTPTSEESGWITQPTYQSVGLGISMTRDIYLYPNIQFSPEEIRAERTNVALSATINL